MIDGVRKEAGHDTKRSRNTEPTTLSGRKGRVVACFEPNFWAGEAEISSTDVGRT
jgi:hypothetical protein